MTRTRKRLLAVVVPIEIAGAVMAWRDLSRRTDRQVRGSRKAWRAVLLLNPGNSLLYWLFGRR